MSTVGNSIIVLLAQPMSTTNVSAPTAPIKKEVLCDKVLSIVREWILSGRVKPGERLIESSIAQQLQISRAPLREALWKLAHQGLVVIEPHKGAYVTKLTVQDIHEIFELRVVLETHAAKSARRHMTPEAESQLERATVELEGAASFADMAAFTMADVKFHQTLADLSRNKHFIDVLNDVSTRFFGYELIQDMQKADRFRFDEMAKIHRRMKELVVSGTESQIEKGFHAAYAEFLKYVLQRFDHD